MTNGGEDRVDAIAVGSREIATAKMANDLNIANVVLEDTVPMGEFSWFSPMGRFRCQLLTHTKSTLLRSGHRSGPFSAASMVALADMSPGACDTLSDSSIRRFIVHTD